MYQRRTLTGTGLTKKTVQGCTAKNLRMAEAPGAAAAIILAGFFCISQLLFFSKIFYQCKVNIFSG
jgi:hypothetical protein